MKNDLNAVYALQNDITCYNPITQEVFDFKSIGGNGGEEFSGRLDGNGFTIRGLRPITKYPYLGLFGEIKNAQVTNLRIVLDSRDINNDSFYNDQIFFGGLAGKAINSEINGVIVEGEWGYEGIVSIDGDYINTNHTNFYRAGGLIGVAENTYISGCVNRVNFKGLYSWLGGIVGRAENTIIYNSKNKADIQPYYNNYSNGEHVEMSNANIGGIASEIFSSQIVDCINDGNRIELTDGQLIRKGKLKGDFVGGIVYSAKTSSDWDNGESQIINCSNFADINAVNDCGGIAVDISQTIIEHSSNCGNLYGRDIGGIVVDAYDSVIHKVSNNGSINSYNYGDHVGGIVGYASNSTILKTVNTNQINLVSDEYSNLVGGVVGSGEHNFLEDCVNLGAINVIGSEFKGHVGGIAGELNHSEINKAYNYVNREDINIIDFFYYSKPYDNAWWGLWRSSFVDPSINSFTGNYSYYSTNVGGIGGFIGYSLLNKVYNFFDVNPTNNNNYTSGGLFGYIFNNIIIDTNNFGEVSPKSPQNNYTNKFIARGSDSYVDGNGADLYLENSKTYRTNLNGVGDWYFDNDSVKVVVTNLNENFFSNCVGVGKIVGSTNSYETTNFGFNGLLKWSFVYNNTPRKCEFWCNEGYYVYYVGSEYVGNIHPTCTEKKMNNPKPIYKRDNPQNINCIDGYSLYNSCDIVFPPKDGALGVVYPSMNCCTQEGFTPTSTSCYCSEIPFCTRLRKLPTDKNEGECVLLGGVCDLNSDCCSNNCQGGVCGSEIFECVVQGGVCDLNSDCCSNNCQGGVCGSEIIPSYNCIGSIDSN
ncbi:MAG: hypothetical protein WC122_03295, partial [archaeon]